MSVNFLALGAGLTIKLLHVSSPWRVSTLTLTHYTPQVWVLKECWHYSWSALAFAAVTIWTIILCHFALMTMIFYGTAHSNFCMDSLFSSQFLCCPFAWNILDGDALHHFRWRRFKRVSPHHFLEVCLEPMFAHCKAHDVCVKEWLSFVKLELCMFLWLELFVLTPFERTKNAFWEVLILIACNANRTFRTLR